MGRDKGVILCRFSWLNQVNIQLPLLRSPRLRGGCSDASAIADAGVADADEFIRYHQAAREGETMEKIVIANLIVFIIVSGICTFVGLDLKKWYSWLAGLYGFLSGCFAGFIVEDGSPSWQLGLLFAFVILSSGAMTRVNRQRYSQEAAKDWLARYGQEKHYSLLARIMEKLVGKR